MPDASAVMQLLLKTQTDFNDLEDDDPQVNIEPSNTPSGFKPPFRGGSSTRLTFLGPYRK